MPPQSYIAADTPIHDVRVYVDGLHGQTRAAALEAAQRLRGSANCFDSGTFEYGVDQRAPGLSSAFSLRVDGTPPAEDGPPPLRVSGEGRFCLEEEAMRCSVTASPTTHGSRVIPSLQLGLGMAGLVTGPFRTEHQGQLILSDVLGRHSLRLGAASRDLRPQGSEKAFLKLPLQSSKTSLTAAGGGHQRWSFFAEVAGLLGDVKIARCEASCQRQGQLLGGHWQISSHLGLAKAMGGATLPLEETWRLEHVGSWKKLKF
eukprot:Skav204612  [mRNA]  locus=scaffold1712:89148:91206:+ [translate_table: standard]